MTPSTLEKKERKMNWNNLKNSKCPQCGELLAHTPYSHYCGCGFTISVGKFDEIVSKMYKTKFGELKDNFEELQNLGHNLIKEDFSDSPYLNDK